MYRSESIIINLLEEVDSLSLRITNIKQAYSNTSHSRLRERLFFENTSIYNRTVTQGTVFKQDDIDRLEIGMSKDQVSFIMGQPSFQNIFDENLWDYYFQVKNGAKIQSEKKLKLFFDANGELEEIEVIKI